jgi:hypothetical protein
MTTDTAACRRLNHLVIEIGRSLLQYAGVVWAWTSGADGAALRARVLRLGAEQRKSVAALAELLDGEGHPVDFGVFPEEYTSLHYVSLDYLLERLVDDQRDVLAECRSAAAALTPGSPAAELLAEVCDRSAAILDELESLQRQSSTLTRAAAMAS